MILSIAAAMPSRRALCLASVTCLALAPATAQEQNDDSGGTLLTFGVDQSATWTENLGMASVSQGATLQFVTDLRLGYRTETRNSSFSFDTGLRLRAVDGTGPTGFDFSSDDPNYALAYTRRTVDTSLSVNATFTEGDLSFDTDPLIYLTDDGFLDLPVDLADLTGTGQRSSLSYGARFAIEEDRPFGLSFGIQVADVDYGPDVTTPELVDTTTITGDIAARFDIDGATRADVVLTRLLTREEGAPERTLTTLDADLTLTRPSGSLGFGIEINRTDSGGLFYGLDVTREILMPDGGLTLNGGLTRTTSDDFISTGSLSYNRNLPGGSSMTARLQRSFTPNTTNGDLISTSMAVTGTIPLTPVATLGLNAAFVRSDESDPAVVTDITSLNATLEYQLTRDWALSATAGLERREETGEGQAQSESLSVTLSRDFSVRY